MHRACAGLLLRASELSEREQHIAKLGWLLKALEFKAGVRLETELGIGQRWPDLLSRHAM